MAIVRWAPFSAFTSLQREMQEMLDRLSTRPFFEGFSFRPTTDIFREGEELIIKAELPGIDPKEELEIDVEGNVLHIRGEKKFEKEIKEEDRFLRECRFGTFSRDVMLPEGVEVDEIDAKYEDGVLTVRVPLPTEVIEEAKKTAIPISVAEKV
jgi:HSP20 family protein